jgi:hypothetical protein
VVLLCTCAWKGDIGETSLGIKVLTSGIVLLQNTKTFRHENPEGKKAHYKVDLRTTTIEGLEYPNPLWSTAPSVLYVCGTVCKRRNPRHFQHVLLSFVVSMMCIMLPAV